MNDNNETEWDEAEDPAEIEVVDLDEEEPPAKKTPNRVFWRLYVTGIATGILLVAVLMLLSDVFSWHPFSTTPAADAVYDLTKTLETYIDRYYWKSDTSDEEFANMAGKGMVSALGDPYSVYMTEEEMKRSIEHTSGDYVGIGCTVGMDMTTGRKYITRIESGKPAEKAGLQVGDEIVALDGEKVQDLSVDDLVSRIHGEEGEKHVFTILRGTETATGSAASGSEAGDSDDGSRIRMDITVVTETIINQSITFRMLENGIGYLRIAGFDRETPDQFRNAISELEKEGMKGLVLDVRNNGGGVLSAVISVLDRLLPAGKLLTETRKGQKDTIYQSTDQESLDLPMAVLINGKSASASEVFAGALQDRKMVPLVGEKSFGKGIVQSIYQLPDEMGGIKLTTGEYLLPTGRSIHEKGLTPDVEVAYTGGEEDFGTDSDNQLMTAVETIS
ncbi:MAG: S41 family peptidase [Eubacterium sp.]|nr:S41 family peptidase [Eubacterium sp.]